MADLKEMREQREKLVTQSRAKADEVTNDTPDERAAEIEREYNLMADDIRKLEKRIEREEGQQQFEANMRKPDTSRIPPSEGRTAAAFDDKSNLDYRRAFYTYLANGGEAGLDPECRTVLHEKRVQVTGTNTSGGFTVPTELLTFVLEAMKAHGPMYTSDLFSVIESTDGAPLNMFTNDDTAVTAGAHTEGTAPTDDGGKDLTFGQKSLSAFAFNTEFVRWSREMNTDSVLNMESFLGRQLGIRLARIANAKLTTGSGSSDVEGIVTNSVAGVTAASATAITADEIIDLLHSVDPAYRVGSTAFMMNDSTLAAVRKLKDGQGNYLWQMGNYQAGVPQNLLGYDVIINQDMASIATGAKTILFGDMSNFYVRKVGAPSMQVLNERFAPDFGILGYIRFDGVLGIPSSIKHLVQA